MIDRSKGRRRRTMCDRVRPKERREGRGKERERLRSCGGGVGGKWQTIDQSWISPFLQQKWQGGSFREQLFFSGSLGGLCLLLLASPWKYSYVHMECCERISFLLSFLSERESSEEDLTKERMKKNFSFSFLLTQSCVYETIKWLDPEDSFGNL